ncbi:hypothetical protein [Cyclobacterium sp.]|uniref:hypothetical protein n=1 Tax=Cyclobacterium sp. TaxID=1966343 RepID=UPI0019BC5AA1|nr:hypothetical protein [Cyclobacterium sp.]MBD3629470.1 hypothetical protein [Cyclobacterium sp.]
MIIKKICIALVFSLAACKINSVPVPNGMEVDRISLSSHPYGSYISGMDTNNNYFAGELIGFRNDTMVVLSQTLRLITKTEVSHARVIIYKPKNYNAGFLMLAPNLVMMAAGIPYGGSALVIGVLFSAVDVAGIMSAKSWEKSGFNYVDWSENPNKLLLYSRFPAGIPSQIDLTALQAENKY